MYYDTVFSYMITYQVYLIHSVYRKNGTPYEQPFTSLSSFHCVTLDFIHCILFKLFYK